jgi:hypothetical protein
MTRVVLAVAAILAGCATLVTAEETPPVKLLQEQTVRVRQLVGAVQAEATLLQAKLDERQRELAELYTQYELDEPRAQKLQSEIVELQRALLANHHRMQVELRVIVDRERFLVLRQRLRYILAPTPAPERVSPAQPQKSVPGESQK